MKIFHFIILCLIASSIYGQQVKVIETQISLPLQYSDLEIKEWNRYSTILNDYYEKYESNVEKLPQNDRAFFEKHNAKYAEAIEGDSPFSVYGIGCSWYCGASYETAVSSSLASNEKNNYGMESIGDDDFRTAWVEGAKGYGIGEYIEFTFEYQAARATECYIANGYNKNADIWKKNSRVKTFNMYENDKLIAIVNLKDTRDLQSFELPYPIPHRPDNFDRNNYNPDKPKPAVKLKFVVTEVYKGDKYDDTAISAMTFSGMDVHCLAEGTLITMADGSAKPIEAIQTKDKVSIYNIKTNEWDKATVKQSYKVTHNKLLKITFDSGISITATDDHPFWSNDGWKSFNPQKTKQYKRYSAIEIGKYTIASKIWIVQKGDLNEDVIKSIEAISTPSQTYTLELDMDGAFVANGILVGQE